MGYLPCTLADMLDDLDERERFADARQAKIEERTADLLEESAADLDWNTVLDCLNEMSQADTVRLSAILADPLDFRQFKTDVGAVKVPGNTTAFRFGTAVIEAAIRTLNTRAENKAQNEHYD